LETKERGKGIDKDFNRKMQMILYGFRYCPCIYESSYSTISIHKTKKGAYSAMKKHRIAVFETWRKLPNQYRKPFKDTFSQDWFIDKITIQD